jgi:3-hydroxyacyl-CoA dehydrogenase
MAKLDFGITNGVAVLTLDNPPVNSLGFELRRALLGASERAEADDAIQAVVLVGSGGHGAAGLFEVA